MVYDIFCHMTYVIKCHFMNDEELNQAKDTGRDDGQKCLDNNNKNDF